MTDMTRFGDHEVGAFLRALFAKMVETADPMQCVPRHLPAAGPGRLVVVGAGKASARMAEAVESVYGPCDGLVITRYGYQRPCQGVEIAQAAHPFPDQSGVAATQRMLALLGGLGPEDQVIALISGGGSALLCAPVAVISLEEKQDITQALFDCGATIKEINVVRKHLSQVKGGQLAAAAYPAAMLSLMISDVPGDDPAYIASGPTVGDEASTQEALAILEGYQIRIPDSLQQALSSGQSGVLPPHSPPLAVVENRVIAAPSQSLRAVAELAGALGCRVKILGDALEGEARTLGVEHATLAKEIQVGMTEGDAPVLLISGGECTVTRRGEGLGGPNAEFLLAAALALDGTTGIDAIACDTDGVDGAADVAGAVISADTLPRAAALGIDPAASLDANDSHRFFAALGDQVVTGPTLTNINDFRAFLIQQAT